MRRTAVWCLIFASLLACLLATLLPTTTRWLSFLSPNAPKSAAEAIAAELGATERADKFVDVKPAQREPTMAVMFAAHHSAAFAWLGGLAPNLVLAAALLKHRAAKKEGRVCFDRKHKELARSTLRARPSSCSGGRAFMAGVAVLFLFPSFSLGTSPPSPPPSPPPSSSMNSSLPSPPPPPGAPVSITFTIDTTLDAFNNASQAAFIDKLALFLAILPADITIVSIKLGSVVVETEIFQREGTGSIRDALINTPRSTLSSQLGETILTVVDGVVESSQPVPASTSASSPSSSPGKKTVVSVVQEEATDLPINLAAIAGGAAAGVAVLVALAGSIRFHRRKKAQAAADLEVIASARAFSEVFAFPLHLCSASDFAKMGKLVIFEDVRIAGQHRVVDLVEDAQHAFGPDSPARLIFLSHQWLAFDGPDPENVQYRVMAAGIETIIRKNGWDPNNTWVWVDYSSIPQRHKPSQLAAINSLALYASFANALIIAAPEAMHSGTGLLANATSYQNRAWCRAEQVCYAVGHGAQNMWMATSQQNITAVDQAWLMTSLLVFEGEMTCCTQKHVFNGVEQPCDRLALLKPIFGLYSNLYANRLAAARYGTARWLNDQDETVPSGNNGNEASTTPATADSAVSFSLEALMEWIDMPQNKARMFPATFQLATEKRGIKVLKRTRLFGNMVAKMEQILEAENASKGAVETYATTSKPSRPNGSNHGAISTRSHHQHTRTQLSSLVIDEEATGRGDDMQPADVAGDSELSA